MSRRCLEIGLLLVAFGTSACEEEPGPDAPVAVTTEPNSPAPPETPTEAEPEPRAEHHGPLTDGDREQIQTKIEAFLQTRWKGVDTAPEELLSAPDLDLLPHKRLKYYGDRSPQMYDPSRWSILRVVDAPHGARVFVELERPTVLSQIRLAKTGIIMHRTTKDGMVVAQRMAHPGSFKLDRRIDEVSYEVVREEGAWKVHMGWSAESDYGDGSENELRRLKRASEIARRDLRPPEEHRDAVYDAEKLADDHLYGDAVAIYRDLVKADPSPPFAADRLATLRKLDRLRTGRLRASGIAVSVDEPRMVLDRAGRWDIPVTVRNRGRHGFVATVELRTADHTVLASETFQVKPKEATDHTFKVETESDAPPSDVHPFVTTLVIDDEKLARKFESPAKSREFERTVRNWREARHRVPTLASDSETLRGARKRFHACGEWPEDELDFVVTIDAEGRADLTEVRGESIDDELESCLQREVAATEFGLGLDRKVAVEVLSSAYVFPGSREEAYQTE